MCRRVFITWCVVAVAVALGGLLPAARAEHNPNGKKLKFEFCPPDEGDIALEGLDCVYDEAGHITSRGDAPQSFPSGVLLVALLWILLPTFIGVRIASDRNASVGMTVLLCLTLGWLGLALVYFLLGGGPAPVTAAGAAGSGRPATGGFAAAARIRELQMLHEQKLISDEEYERRRTEILAEV